MINYVNALIPDATSSYRLRLVNTGSFATTRFSIDNHPLTVIEADGTFVDPVVVAGISKSDNAFQKYLVNRFTLFRC